MAKHRIPPIYKPNIPMDILEKMNIMPNLEKKRVRKKKNYRVKHLGSRPKDSAFFVQKKFPNRFSVQKYRNIKRKNLKVDCDEEMNGFAQRANMAGLQT